MPVCVEHETSVAELHNECIASRGANTLLVEYRCDVLSPVTADYQPSNSSSQHPHKTIGNGT